jgi:hypothetical protein
LIEEVFMETTDWMRKLTGRGARLNPPCHRRSER